MLVTALALYSVSLSPSRLPPPVMMGGLTGLPRIPDRALALTKKFNPGGEYSESIATLFRDLETLYGEEETSGLGGGRAQMQAGRSVDSGVKTNKFRGFTYSIDVREETAVKAVRKHPSLLNPAVSNRFVFAESKAILTQKLGSQRAAIELMKQDPSILQEGRALEAKPAAQIKAAALYRQLVPLVGAAAAGVAMLVLAVQTGYLSTNEFAAVLAGYV